MQKLLLLFCFLNIPNLYGQDTIIRIDGDTIPAKVLGTDEDFLYFQKHNDTSGLKYWIAIADIHKIIFSNGRIKVYNATIKTRDDLLTGYFLPEKLKSNILYLSFNTFIGGNAGLIYERQLWNKKIGLMLPIYLPIGSIFDSIKLNYLIAPTLAYYPFETYTFTFGTTFTVGFGETKTTFYDQQSKTEEVEKAQFFFIGLGPVVQFNTMKGLVISWNANVAFLNRSEFAPFGIANNGSLSVGYRF